jgi:hypothetical protein
MASSFLTSAPDGGEWSSSRPCRHCTEILMGLKCGLVIMESRKMFTPTGDRTKLLGPKARNLVAIPTELSLIFSRFTADLFVIIVLSVYYCSCIWS